MNNFFYIFSFIFGLLIGSFINCLVYRLHEKKSFTRGRSFCPECKHTLAWYDNIPLVSFILLRAKCRYCSKRISWQYPFVELATAIIFFLITLVAFQNPHPDFLIIVRNWIFSVFLIIIFIYDLKYYLILDKVSLPAIVIALALNLGINFNNFFSSLISLLIGALICGGFFLLQFVISRGTWIGGGDIRLGVLMGVILGWPLALLALALAYISGAAVGIFLIVFKKRKMSSQIPFGTFLSLAALVSLLFGSHLLNLYTSLLLF